MSLRCLGVGIATVDVVFDVADYPAENAEVRAAALQQTRGGNVTNTLVALQQWGNACAWAGMLCPGPGAELVLADLQRVGVDTRWCRWADSGTLPTSVVLRSAASASRTIVHYRDLPELSAEAFAAIDLDAFDWIHFEGRHVPALGAMLRRVRAHGGPRCSLEVEKPRPAIETLFDLPDLLLFSRAYAEQQGFATAPELLAARAAHTPAVCAWGEQGAWSREPGAPARHAPACPPARLVDTLAAGDVFNAAVVHAYAGGADLAASTRAACATAGAKCGRQGLHDLADLRPMAPGASA